MISIEELYHPQDLISIDVDQMLNLHQLHFKLNFLRSLTEFPWTVNRGFSTTAEQIAIYERLGKPPKLGSCHLKGAAADIADPDGILKKWVLDHLELIEGLFLFMEDFDATPTWVHLQIFPYASWQSGKTHFFMP